MKRFLIAAALLFPVVLAFGQKTDVTKEKFAPYYTKDGAPRLELILPEPPAYGSLRFQEDCALYQWGKSIRNTERGEQAVKDASIHAGYFMARFSPAVGRNLTPEAYPELYRLMYRAHKTEQQAGASAKAHFRRVRPYQLFKEESGVPRSENPTDFTSYPSGHTHASWLEGMILTALDPEHTEEIMKIAYEMGQSRVIVGFHYQSDVDAGRLAASVTFARLCAIPEFREQLDKAAAEYRANTK